MASEVEKPDLQADVQPVSVASPAGGVSSQQATDAFLDGLIGDLDGDWELPGKEKKKTSN